MANALNLPEPTFGNPRIGGNYNSMVPGLSGIMQGLFGNSGKPYSDATSAYNNTIDQRFPQLQENINPYMEAGTNAIPQVNNALRGAEGAYGNVGASLSRMSDPRAFMDSILKGYQESPGAMMEREAGNKGINNAASASGMLGSGALYKSAADYNQRLTARDMQQYLQNILGINKDYLSGEMGRATGLTNLGTNGYGSLAHMGEQGAASLNNLIAQIMQHQAEANREGAYGERKQEQEDEGSFWEGLFNIGKSFIPGSNLFSSFGGR